jgi:hypothetical protein
VTLSRNDLLVVGALLSSVPFYAIYRLELSSHPAEDAAMLLRYAENFAGGAGIVWNAGEDPVEGATDFLFVVGVGLLQRIGIKAADAARLIGFTAHLATVLLIYLFSRRVLACGTVLSFTAASFLAIGPALRHVEAAFGTPFFALFTTMLWCFGVVIAYGRDSRWHQIGFVGAGLLAGLARPEGVFMFVFVLAGVVVYKGLRTSRRFLVYSLSAFVFLGGCYFLWRWTYFGYPFPNAFYKKGGGALYYSSLVQSIANVIRMSLPFFLVLGLTYVFKVAEWWRWRAKSSYESADSKCRGWPSWRWLLLLGFPVVGFTVIWVFLSDEMNFFMRFQYPILPIVLLGALTVLERLTPSVRAMMESKGSNGNFELLIIVLMIGTLGYPHVKNGYISATRDGRYDVALLLRDYRDRGYTMAVTEAGLLPWVSGWRAIDAWGLNDESIAHAGVLETVYLEINAPELIMIHAYFSPLVDVTETGDEWWKMATTLNDFAERRGYVLAAAFGVSPYDSHYYYVRRDFDDSDTIIRRIRETPYFWRYGPRCVNFALTTAAAPSLGLP